MQIQDDKLAIYIGCSLLSPKESLRVFEYMQEGKSFFTALTLGLQEGYKDKKGEALKEATDAAESDLDNLRRIIGRDRELNEEFDIIHYVNVWTELQLATLTLIQGLEYFSRIRTRCLHAIPRNSWEHQVWDMVFSLEKKDLMVLTLRFTNIQGAPAKLTEEEL